MQQTVETAYISKYQESLFDSYVVFYFSGAADDPVYISSSPLDIDSVVLEKTTMRVW